MKRDTWLPILVGTLAVLAMTWPWALHPLHLVGSPVMEADNHLWMLWRASQDLLGGGGPWANWPVGDPRPVQDLVHVPLSTLLMPLGPALAYGVVLSVDLAAAALGGWLLSREAGASRAGALVGMVALTTTPFLSGAVVFGLSEGFTLGWLALAGALALRTARTGSWRWAVASGLCLSAFFLSGWYALVLGMLSLPAWVVWVSRQHRPDCFRWGLLSASVLISVLPVIPPLLWFLGHGDAAGLAVREPPVWVAYMDWRHAPPGGTDPLNLLLPSLSSTELARSAYLGLGALGLGLFGAITRKEARWPWVGVVLMGFLATGWHLTIAGSPVVGTAPLPGPAAWLAAVLPPLRGMLWWYRAAGVAAVFLAPLAALGATRLLQGRSIYLALPLVLLVGADQLLLSDAPWPRATYEAHPPGALSRLPGEGPALLLPFDAGSRRWPQGVPRAYQRWQPWLDRPISENYEGPDALLAVPVVAWADRECRSGRPAPVQGEVAIPDQPPSPTEARAQLAQLHEQGLELIVVVRPRASTPNRCVGYLEEMVGHPTGVGPEASWWVLDSR